jgi:hypothetical protein
MPKISYSVTILSFNSKRIWAGGMAEVLEPD